MPHLERLAAETDVVPAVNQIEAHPYVLNDEVRDYGRAHGILTEAWSPIAQGQVLGDPAVVEVASAVGRTPAQAVLRWLSVTVQREAARTSRAAARTQPTEPEQLPDDLPVAEGPEKLVLDDSTNSVLWQHVTRLSDRCQRLLRVIAFMDRPDYNSLSKDLDMPVGSIGPTRARCLAKVRTALREGGAR